MSGSKIINKYFTDNYNSLLELATARVLTNKREYDPAILVSNAWEHCTKHEESINCETVCQVYAFRYITTQALWRNSETNLENDRNCKRIFESEKKKGIIEVQLLPIHGKNQQDYITDKIELEEWINTRKAVLEMFKLYLREKDTVKYKTLDLMLKGYNSSGLLSDYLGITRNGAWNLLRNVRNELNEYKKRYNL